MADCIIIEKTYATYKCYDSYIIGIPRPGAVIKRRHAQEALEAIKKFYDKPFGYIGDRIEPSSLELAVYPFIEEAARANHLASIAIVAHRSLTRLLAESEALMVHSVPFKIFDTLEEAEAWTLEELGKTPA